VDPQSRSGRSDEEKNSQPLPGLEPTIIQPVAQKKSVSKLCDGVERLQGTNL
jgi:hypothetical protein